jgi:hypothetical protein
MNFFAMVEACSTATITLWTTIYLERKFQNILEYSTCIHKLNANILSDEIEQSGVAELRDANDRL